MPEAKLQISRAKYQGLKTHLHGMDALPVWRLDLWRLEFSK